MVLPARAHFETFIWPHLKRWGHKEATETMAAAKMAVAVAERVRSRATEEREVAQQEAKLAVDKLKVCHSRTPNIVICGGAAIILTVAFIVVFSKLETRNWNLDLNTLANLDLNSRAP